MTATLEDAFRAIDDINRRDLVLQVDGEEQVPRALLYGWRMSETLAGFVVDPSPALTLAVRAQHVGRFEIPRSQYPQNRPGYHAWRNALKRHHGTVVANLLRALALSEELVARVQALVEKRDLKSDPESQALEDVACLVFLRYELDTFSARHKDDKVVSILRKTWKKMSLAGQTAALRLPLSARAEALVHQALTE